ncbi:MAG: tetratricopeptide repeat protein [Verrucomicrobiales bacterium]|nr:tetratricopeptide repeat protein [Verrucomicrobiales bacterium]
MSELNHGLLLQDQGRLEEAEAIFYSVLAREPENDFVYSRLALCQLNQQGKKQRALESIGEAIRLRSDSAFYHAVKSLILSGLHKGKEALVSADDAIRLDPEDAFPLAAKAAAYCELDQWAKVEEWSTRALQVDSDHAMAANLLTHSLRLQGKSDQNAVAVEQLLAASPEDSFAHVNAGWSALQRGNSQQAETHFREALRLEPDSDAARDGLLESFRARSGFYRIYLSYCFFMQRFTGGKQWGIIVGIYIAYQLMRRWLETINPMIAAVFVLLWLALILWVWLAPGIGNFLILMDRSARLALKPGEKWQGLAVGGGLLLGVVSIATGFGLSIDTLLLGGIGLIASTVPASLTFANESRKGRMLFGSITGAVYAMTLFVVVKLSLGPGVSELDPVTKSLGGFVLLSALLCTWLGNVRALRQEEVS